MNKLLYVLSLLGTISHVVAADEFVVGRDNEGPLSPQGYHGVQNGGMCDTVYGSSEVSSPTVITVRVLGGNGKNTLETRSFPVTDGTLVAEFKSNLISTLRISAAHRLMLNGVEVMRVNVDKDGELLTLASVFSGTSGVPIIDVVADPGRSPMLSPVPESVCGDVSPIKVDEAD